MTSRIIQRVRICRRARYAPLRDISHLQEAVQLALQHNHLVRINQFKVEEQQHVKEAAKSDYFPSIRNESSFIHLTDTQLIQIGAGTLGTVAGSSFSYAVFNY